MLPSEEEAPPDPNGNGDADNDIQRIEDVVDDARHGCAGYRVSRRQGGSQSRVDLGNQLVRRLYRGIRRGYLVDGEPAQPQPISGAAPRTAQPGPHNPAVDRRESAREIEYLEKYCDGKKGRGGSIGSRRGR